MKQRIVFAYSGSAAGSAAIPLLVRGHDADVVAVTLDLGQGRELEEIRERALAAGAARAHVLDAKEELARDFVLPALHAGALHDAGEPLIAALAGPLISRKLVELSAIEAAWAVGHGCTGIGAARVEAGVRALSPHLPVLAPVRRADDAEAAHEAVPAPGAASITRVRRHLFGRTIEFAAGTGAVDSRGTPAVVSESVCLLTTAATGALDAAAEVEIRFERGTPVAVNGVDLAVTELIDSLSIIAGRHGVGRVVSGEAVGGPWRVHEIPAAVVLDAAHTALEAAVLPPDLVQLKDELARRYAGLVRDGCWFTPMREALDAFNARAQEQVTGAVRMRLLQGAYTIRECRPSRTSAGPLPAAIVPPAAAVQRR